GGENPSADQGPVAVNIEQAESVDAPASADVGETQTLVLAVPKMHCQFSCYPAVEKHLKKENAVVDVKLAKQPNEDELTNRQVVVTIADGFDAQSAIERLAGVGFDGASVVESAN
ncbi:MAG: hypothetical protein AAFP90_11035, partial [Planctomycetota bacterium]